MRMVRIKMGIKMTLRDKGEQEIKDGWGTKMGMKVRIKMNRKLRKGMTMRIKMNRKLRKGLR